MIPSSDLLTVIRALADCDLYELEDILLEHEEYNKIINKLPTTADGAIIAIEDQDDRIVYAPDGTPGAVYLNDDGWEVWPASNAEQGNNNWPLAISKCYSKPPLNNKRTGTG